MLRAKGSLYPVLLCLLAAVAALHAHVLDYRGDDAFITFRYVRNLVEGHGLVFNLGERVEGYSNFAWVMLLAFAKRLAPALSLETIAHALGGLAGAMAVVQSGRLAASLSGKPHAGVLAALVVASSTSFAVWTGSMLETPLFALALVTAAERYARGDAATGLRRAAPWLALLALTRPEGLSLAGLAIGLEGLAALWARDRSLRHVALGAGLVVAIGGAHLAFRRAYYGEWLPNTYYAKVAPGIDAWERGFRYLRDCAWLQGVLLLLLPLAVLPRARRERSVRFAWVLVAGYLAYIVHVGGDGLPFVRFFAHLVPLLAALASVALVTLYGALARGGVTLARVSSGVAALLLVAGASWPGLVVLLAPDWPWLRDQESGLTFPSGAAGGYRYRWFDQYFCLRVGRAGRWLDEHLPPGAVIAANPAGIGFYTRHTVIDMLGLNDRVIARRQLARVGRGRAGHEKGDGAYVLRRAPDVILLGNVALLPRPLEDAEVERFLAYESEREIWRLPEFRAHYERVVVPVDDVGDFRWFTFYRRIETGK